MGPSVSPDTEFFWAGTQVGELRIQRCGACGALRHPPGPACLSCGATEKQDYQVAAGTGTVYSYVVHRHPPVPGKRLPIVVALVELTEGVRMMAELTGTAAGYEPEAITPVIQPLYCDLFRQLASAGVSPAGPALAYYEDTPAGDGAIVVHAAVPVVAEPGGEYGFRVVDLPEVDSAAAIIHHGSMDDVLSTGQALARWIDASGYRSAGYAREATLEHHADADQWVTELQQPIECE